MRDNNPELEQYRDNSFRSRKYKTTAEDKLKGVFLIPSKGVALRVVSSGAEGPGEWEHVSISTPHRNPNWDEMNRVKDLFWNDDETVIQFHPKKSEYRNMHPYCLHLWKKKGVEHELPPSNAVAPDKDSLSPQAASAIQMLLMAAKLSR